MVKRVRWSTGMLHPILFSLVALPVRAFLSLPSGLKPTPRAARLRAAGSSGSEASGRRVILGINKYSHDAGVCVICSKTGEVLFVQEKERLSRKKHDAGDVADLVFHALESTGSSLDDVELVVQNNHHFRVAPFERRVPWAVAQEHYPVSYEDEYNLLPKARRHELSHHLAHLWSAITQAPFDQGLCVVMDGMGELRSAMTRALSEGEEGYTHDLLLSKLHPPSFLQIPAHFDPDYSYREAESAYLFDKLDITPVFKRWTRERSPPELFNHGFENMESMGAVYSRLSSHVFGDWNTCGKVMGLSPYGKLMRREQPSLPDLCPPLMSGDLLRQPNEAGAFNINWDTLESLPHANEWAEADAKKTEYYGLLADRVQRDLEDVCLKWIKDLKEKTGARNLCLVGGVALNSVLNGRVIAELGFERVFVPPYPGDEGIAVGCAVYGLHHLKDGPRPPRWGKSLSPYQGRAYDDEDMWTMALDPFAPWIEVRELPSLDDVVTDTATALSSGQTVAWFQGRAEVGPRALGCRSLLADPRNVDMIDHLNRVKGREAFRPFAPSVLAEHASEWFDNLSPDGSPFMSLTVPAKPEKRDVIPAVCHVDGTARLQTLSESDNPWYHRLISAFFRLTGVPMVLNTSFNIKGEPIVESPEDAIKSFLATAGGLDRLVMGRFVITARPFPVDMEGFDASLAVPARVEYVFEDVLSNAETGEATRVRVGKGGLDGKPVWVELSGGDLDLIVLQAIDGLTPLADVAENVMADFEEEGYAEEDIVNAVRRLYRQNLVFFETI